MLAIQICQREAKVFPLSKKVCVYIASVENIVYVEFSTVCGFRNPLEVLEFILHGPGGTTVGQCM